MVPFLRQVASAYYGRGEVETSCFIFPNRRSEVFFKKYLCGKIASSAGGSGASGKEGLPERGPTLMPLTFTVNDFMGRMYEGKISDRVTLMLDLYGSYSRLNPNAESLDDFIWWGDVILSDFNDTDKYLADPARLYTNVSDYKSIQDSFSYLNDRQRSALEHFLGHFRTSPERGGKEQPVKENFLKIWNLLLPLYRDFRTSLESDGRAYEGMVYRAVAERFRTSGAESVIRDKFPDTGLFVFVGLNALNECEKTVLRKMRDASLAEFCWDYSGSMISDPDNRSSVFLSENVREFPMSFSLDDGDGIPEIHVISVSSGVGQAKLLPQIFSEIASRRCGGDLSGVGQLEDGGASDCAVVLPDENLLMPVLNTIPPEIGHINVTMGYPMSCSAFHSFMSHVVSLQMNTREKDGKCYFWHKAVRSIFSDGIFREAAGEEGMKAVAGIKSRANLYMSQEELSATPYMAKLFRPVLTDRSAADPVQADAFAAYLLEVTETTGMLLKKTAYARMELEFAKEYRDCIVSLRKKTLPVQPKTYAHLLQQLMSSVTVPFKGEPLRGLQIMGPLETRALDFSNVIILSSNEGVFPRRNVSMSFIPPELRRGFGLPTYEHQDAVWAYYFYRLLSRAENVWMIYDSRTAGLKSGEESRYIKQLQYHFNVPLRRSTVSAALSGSGTAPDVIKTPEDVQAIRSMTLSASALQTYLSCPARFYYQYVKRLEAEEEVSENLDNGMLGRVYHGVMQALYLGDEAMEKDIDFNDRKETAALTSRLEYISRDYLVRRMKDGNLVKRKINSLIMKETHAFEVVGRNLVVADVILRYVMKTLERDLELLKSKGTDKFRIYGLEQEYVMNFNGFRLKGYIDRLDSFSRDSVRIVDYKTGKVSDADEIIDDGNAENVADALFGTDNGSRPKIALQLYIYDKLLNSREEFAGKEIVNCIYSASRLFTKAPEQFAVSPKFHSIVDEKLAALLGDMTDVTIPFSRTGDIRTCAWCDFKMICGR